MKKPIIKAGERGFIIYLPKSETAELGYKYGDELFITSKVKELIFAKTGEGKAYTIRAKDNGYVISIPPQWVREHSGLGEQVEVSLTKEMITVMGNK